MKKDIWNNAQLANAVYTNAVATYWITKDERLWKAAQLASEVYEELIKKYNEED